MIYFDNAATTKCSQLNVQIIQKYLEESFFNPSANYNVAYNISKVLDECREQLLLQMNGKGKIIFTSSGTESDVMAMLGTQKSPRSQILISSAEHSAIYQSANQLKAIGNEVVLCPTFQNGTIRFDEFEQILNENVSLVSVMHVNNETGGINDLERISQLLRKKAPNAIFHSDGVQSFGKIKIDLQKFGVDLFSISGHKIGGMKGIGGLFIKDGVRIKPLLVGGTQEYGLRASTENVPGILSITSAFLEAQANFDCIFTKIQALWLKLFSFFSSKANFLIISDELCSPYIFTFTNTLLRGEVLQRLLEQYSIYVGTGSACSSKSSTKRLPKALSIPHNYIDGIIRISFSHESTLEEVEFFLNRLKLIFKEHANYEI